MRKDPWADVEDLDGRAHYHALGLTKSATQQEIKAAYRNLVKRSHPDKGAAELCSHR